MAKPFKIASLFWSIVLSIAVIALVGSILLPSTKRARFDFTEAQRQRELDQAAATASSRATPSQLPHDPTLTSRLAPPTAAPMNLTNAILNAGLSFLVLFLIFRPLELSFPANPAQRFFRPHWWTDLFYLLGQYLFFNGAVLYLLQRAQPLTRAATPHSVSSAIARLPWLAQAILVVLLGDFLIYWGHRLQHRVPFLWRFHSIHHSAEHLDWLAAHREHPVDALYTIFLVNAPIFALGFPPKTLAYFAAFRGLWAVFIHANVRLPIGPLRVLIGAPELHHWHHHRSQHSGNYANVSPLFDYLFGTYHCPDHEPPSLGTTDPVPQSYLGQLTYPFRPQPSAQPYQAPAPPVHELYPSPTTGSASP